jgi:hypothetical protein
MGSSISVQITGFVGSEPQVKEVGEQRVVSFSLAVNRQTTGRGPKIPLICSVKQCETISLV